MAYTKTNWRDRLVEKARTFLLKENTDGSTTLVDSPGEVYEEGTPINAENMNHMEQGIADAHEQIEQLSSELFLLAHPVGIVVPFANTVDPNTLGGTWERFAKGRTLVGVNENDANFNTVKKTGGSSTVTLTDKQIASHRHGISGDLISFTSANNGNVTMNKGTNFGSLYSLNADTNTGWAGNGEAHNNLQPYETVYYWIRTA